MLGLHRSLLCLLLMLRVSTAAAAINVNTASAEELMTIKGIGPKTAERILEERSRAGDFTGPEDIILRVKGMGQKTLAKLQGQLKFAGPSESASKPEQPAFNSGGDQRTQASVASEARSNQVADALKSHQALVRPKYIDGPYYIKVPKSKAPQ